MRGSWKTEALQLDSSRETLCPVWNPRLFPSYSSGEIFSKAPEALA